MSHLGDLLKTERERSGLSRQELADKAIVSIRSVYNIENGQSGNVTTLFKINKVLGVRAERLVAEAMKDL